MGHLDFYGNPQNMNWFQNQKGCNMFFFPQPKGYYNQHADNIAIFLASKEHGRWGY